MRPAPRPFTQREMDMLGLLVAGWTQREIAREVGVSEPRVSQALALARVRLRWATRLRERGEPISRELEAQIDMLAELA